MIFHNDINEELQFLAQSEIRLKILDELNKKPNNARGLVKQTKINYSSVSSNLNKLEKRKHIKKIKNKYCVNPMTEIYFKTLLEFKKSIELIQNYDSFWDKHNINRLTLDSIRNINDLTDSKLIETTPLDIYKTHNTIKKQLVESDNVKAIFPYMHPEYPKIIEKILENEGTIELIIPKSIFKGILTSIDADIRKKSIKNEKLKVHIIDDDLDLYLTICDETMSLGLFKNDGSFDQNRILISNTQKSHDWAEELFQNIKGSMIL